MNRKIQHWEGASIAEWIDTDHPQGRLSGLCEHILAMISKLPSIATTAGGWKQHSMTSSQEGLVMSLSLLACLMKTWSHLLAYKAKHGLEIKRDAY